MQRRSFIKTVGGIGAATTLGAAGLALSGSAVAASSDLTISGTTLSNDDGDVTQVGVTLDHDASWDGFDVPVEAVAYRDVIKKVEGDGSTSASHVLYDNTDSPVLLANWSTDGSGSDGWGGPDEHTSGPGTSGSVDVGIDWTVLAENPSSAAKSVESPGQVSDFALDNDTDDSDKTTTLRYVKEVSFYTSDSSGSYTSTDGSTTLRLMGGDDGTMQKVQAQNDFVVTVTNESATADSGGSGSSSAS